MRSATLLLFTLILTSAAWAAGALGNPPPPELTRHCPNADKVKALWDRREVIAAAESGSVECLRFVLRNVEEPSKKAAGALAELQDWDVRHIAAGPVVEELLSRADFSDKQSDAHAVLLGLVKYQEYDLLQRALRLGADPNIDDRHDGRGEIPLNIAARYGDHRAIELLLKHGADINLRGNGGRTPLHRAVGQKKPATVALLLQRGANPNQKDLNGMTPWLCACGDTCGMNELVQSGGSDAEAAQARVRREIMDLLAPVAREKPDARYCNPASVRSGQSLTHSPNLKYLPEMLGREHPPFLDLSDDGGWTPLNQAVFEDSKAAFLLIKAGAGVNIAALDGTTPLHRAAEKGDPALVGALLKAGANPSAMDKSGRVPLSMTRNADVMRLLRQSGTPTSDKGVVDALFAAMGRGDQEMVSTLLAEGVPLRGCGQQGYSLLGYSLLGKDSGLFWKLLKNGADIHEQCPAHSNLLVHALYRFRGDRDERHRIVMELIERGADIHRPQLAHYPGTPLIAAIHRDSVLVDYLLRQGVDVNAMLPDGRTALRAACSWHDDGLVLRLLEAGADPNLRSPKDEPIMVIAAGRSARVVESLLIYGAEADVSDAKGRTALQLSLGAAWPGSNRGNPRSAFKLLQFGADPQPASGLLPLSEAIRHYNESPDWKIFFDELIKRAAVPVRHGKFRPLHFAVSKQRAELIPALRAAGEQPSSRDADGKTAFQIAEENGCEPCLVLLRQHTPPP